jgi:hypothetical protein
MRPHEFQLVRLVDVHADFCKRTDQSAAPQSKPCRDPADHIICCQLPEQEPENDVETEQGCLSCGILTSFDQLVPEL